MRRCYILRWYSERSACLAAVTPIWLYSVLPFLLAIEQICASYSIAINHVDSTGGAQAVFGCQLIALHSNRLFSEQVSGMAPSPRGGIACTSIGSKIILFGGSDREPSTFDDLWVFDGKSHLVPQHGRNSSESDVSMRPCMHAMHAQRTSSMSGPA